MNNLMRFSWVLVGMTMSLVSFSAMLPSAKKPVQKNQIHAPLARR